MHMSKLSVLFVATAMSGAVMAEEAYYNPSNVGSPTGVTIGSELYRTIGCPGKALIDKSCKEEVKPAPVQAEAPAPVVVPEPAPVQQVEAPAPEPVQAQAAPAYFNPMAFCFTNKR